MLTREDRKLPVRTSPLRIDRVGLGLLKTAALLIAISVSMPAYSQQASAHFDGKTWWEHVKFLADDKLEGRETGSDGLRKAEAYIVEQLEKDGLKPAGSDGFYQPVKFRSRQIVEKKNSSLALVRDGKSEPLALGEDAYFSTLNRPGAAHRGADGIRRLWPDHPGKEL